MEKLYVTIANEIRKLLDEGSVKPGDRLLTEKELCNRYHVSRTTVRAALKQVDLCGKLRRVKGSGTYVATMESINRTTLFMNSFAAELKQRGVSVVTEVVEFRWLTLEEDLPTLKLHRGDKAVKLVRLRYGKGCFDKGPVVYTTSYFPPHIGEQVMKFNLETTTIHDIYQSIGISRDVCKKILTAAQLPPKDCRIVGEAENALFISLISTNFDASGEPVEYTLSYYPIRRNCFEIIS